MIVAVAIAAFGGAYAFLSGGQGARQAAPVADATPTAPTDEVLVAGRDLPMGSSVGPEDLAWQIWPKAAVSDLMIARSRRPAASRTRRDR